jgi:hypothetical protein
MTKAIKRRVNSTNIVEWVQNSSLKNIDKWNNEIAATWE